ncbi:putative disease resistance RPP13-like protein 1-like isoform X2 [Capsicum annuum]|nr:putative disease resistance RPP13-like protein 1-like isoform X2 [Capsicum annuum]
MEIGLAVGGAFLSSALGVLFDRLAPHGDLLKMFQKNKHDVRLLKKLKMTLVGLQAVLSDAENKQASNQHVNQWLNELRDAVDGAENLMDEEKLEDTIETLEDLQKQIAWFCVSEPYDAFRITKGLLQEIGSLQVDDNLNQLQVKFKEILKGKRFLIVLDDMWNENYNEWSDLWNVFVQGGIGSKIIVTTRKEGVALMMGSEQISKDTLSIDDSWSLFKRHAFENMNPMGHLEIEEVGKQTASKCKGLPLALKTLAGMLRSKSEVEGWRNYPFRKEQVIHLWIANGLVSQETIKDLGNEYFLELRSRSLSKRVPNPSQQNTEAQDLVTPRAQEYARKTRFEHKQGRVWKIAWSIEDLRTHGFGQHLMGHDLVIFIKAQIASSKLCVRLEECQGSHMLEQSRHMSYSMGGGGDFEKLKPLFKTEQLRTLLPISFRCHKLSKRVLHNILPSLRSLRALSLSHHGIVELPNDLFIKLKLLRFLDLSRTEIKKLPDSICALYNLETLLLSSCYFLEELPLQIEKLINLRHLDISDTSQLKMPLHLSKLKNLQVLVGAKFLLGGWRTEDFGEAHYLYGSLSILALQNFG